MTRTQLALLYAVFAAGSIAANILTQALWLEAHAGPFSVSLSIAAGTATGLVVKYLLDKRWIFRFQPKGKMREARAFVLYTTMGIATTVIFWGMEGLFHWLFRDDLMRYLGGVIGLTIGYFVKYQLDKRFVFR